MLIRATAIRPLPALSALAAATSEHTLWYDEPATDWESQALPIGNGAMGAMVFGGVQSERLQFNEKSLWTGGPGSTQGYDHSDWTTPRPTAVQEVVDAINSRGSADPEWVAGKLGQGRKGSGAYQTFGDLELDVSPDRASYSGYRCELDIADAVARVNYTGNGVTYDREYFASHPDKVVVGRLGASATGKVSFTLRYKSPRADFTTSAANGRLRVRGTLADNRMVFEAQISVRVDGGTVTSAVTA